MAYCRQAAGFLASEIVRRHADHQPPVAAKAYPQLV
jgi:hypothetical protein